MCESDFIQAEETYEFVFSVDAGSSVLPRPDCVELVSSQYQIWYYQKENIQDIFERENLYEATPKCYGLLSTQALEETGILRMQNLSALSLTGQGVFVAIIDTGERVIIMSS